MKLWEYSGKNIQILADDGRIYSGIADLYTSALDNPDGLESISVRNNGQLIEFTKSEIMKITLA